MSGEGEPEAEAGSAPATDGPKADEPVRRVVPTVPDVAWEELPGRQLVVVDAVGTVALGLITAVAAVADTDATNVANLVVSGALFVGGCVAFALGFLRAVGRSRYEVVDLAGLFYLTGSAPRTARRRLLGLWFAQIAVAVVAVFVTSPPFAVMAPVWGIGLLTLWGARHATFATRPTTRRR